MVNIIQKSMLLITLAILMTANSQGQICAGSQTMDVTITLDTQTQQAVMDSILKTIREIYIYPDRAEEVIGALNKRVETGTYNNIIDAFDYAQALTTDLREITGDLHFGVVIQPRGGTQPVPSCAAICDSPASLKSDNYGFRTVKQLAGNVGYLEMTMFVDTAYSRPIAEAAMQFLSGVDALILDLRSALGGYLSVGQFLAGYLLEAGTELHTGYNHVTGQVKRIDVLKPSNVEPRTDLPVYILTGPLTASAAEALAYDLKHLGRATIIGETTAGAGHCANLAKFEFPRFSMELMIPVEEPINPVTKSNWDKTGVKPDIEVPARDALAEANQRALQYLASKTNNPGESWALEWASMTVKRDYNALKLSPEKLAEYTGSYGPRKITLEGDHLVYKRDGFRAEHKLVPLDTDLFALEGVDIMRLRFNRDENGVINGVTGLYDRGNRDSHPKNL